MPWHTVQNHAECTESKPWAVVKDDDGSVEGCHATEAEADEQMAALYANEADASDDTEALGGKPNQGTKKDKRLHENKAAKKKYDDDSEDADEDTEDFQAMMDQMAEVLVTHQDRPEEMAAAMATFAARFAKKTATLDAPARWSGVLTVEDTLSGDQREFSKNALTWADLPIPLRWKKEDAHGGMNDVTVAVGLITEIERDGNNITGKGVFDLGSEDGREAHRRVDEGFLYGISIDADDITDADVELVWPESGPEEDGEDPFAMLFANPEKIVYHAGRIRAATLCDIPAFVEAKIALDDSVVASITAELPSAAELDAKLRAEIGDTVTAGAIAIDTYRPPKEWFANPKLSVPMNVIVTDDGRVYGHAAHWNECHIGHPDMCVTAPYEDSHPYYMTGEVVCSDGTRVQVGQVTIDTGHAPLAYDARRAAEHYDDTGAAVADVAVGNDEHGIWIAGAVRPGVDPKRVRDLRAAGKVSGDWRRIGGSLRLVGLLGVNIAGFHTPQVKSRVAGGMQLALVAAGQPHLGGSTVDLEKRALQMVMERLAQRLTPKD